MSILEYLKRHLPKDKASHIIEYLADAKCSIRITKPRKTKRGDFRQSGKNLSISVNHDSNTFRFLFTLVHEIAHLKTFLDYGHTVKPHGEEWKQNFQALFYLFQMEEEFANGKGILEVIEIELKDPKACSGVNLTVEKAFAQYDDVSGTYLEELKDGDTFNFRGHLYQKLETRRTRVMCLNVSNQRKYTINKAALVEVCE
jgi:hypothetical protein